MQKGTTHSDETKQKMSAARKGKPKSPETREKMRKGQQARQARRRAELAGSLPKPL